MFLFMCRKIIWKPYSLETVYTVLSGIYIKIRKILKIFLTEKRPEIKKFTKDGDCIILIVKIRNAPVGACFI